MSAQENGGAAFPHPSDQFAGGTTHWAETGMTLRDYFIAHAPAKPQPWFKVTPAGPRPLDRWIVISTGAEYPSVHAALEAAGGNYDDDVQNISFEAIEAWSAELTKRRYTEWPVAWADAMLAARSA